jgi:hypothetical protein
MAPRATAKPRRALTKANNRLKHRDEHLRRLAAARTPSGRLGAATAYLRSAIRAAVDGDAAARLVEELVPELVRHADQLLTPRRNGR